MGVSTGLCMKTVFSYTVMSGKDCKSKLCVLVLEVCPGNVRRFNILNENVLQEQICVVVQIFILLYKNQLHFHSFAKTKTLDICMHHATMKKSEFMTAG